MENPKFAPKVTGVALALAAAGIIAGCQTATESAPTASASTNNTADLVHCYGVNVVFIAMLGKRSESLLESAFAASGDSAEAVRDCFINYIDSNPLKIKEGSNPDISQIISMINQFSMDEYEKKKQKTDEMPFGKYKFKKVSEVASFDKQYLKWLVKQECLSGYPDVKENIKKYLI